MERMPDRQILDFLVQFFVTEINWFVLLSATVPRALCNKSS
jgi:hypothetical protein